jgi:hypothetical protein
MNARSRLLALSIAAAVGGCASDSPAGAADQPSQEEPRRGACASSAECPRGARCTTEHGACAPPPGCRPGMACAAVCYGTCVPAGACRSDWDCRTFSDYCTGCDCRALSVCEKDPPCPRPGVQCLVDPCSREEAFCDAGRCALRDRRVPCPPEECGPQLGMPNTLCPDGTTVAGPSGRCLADAAGTCGWEIVSCPDPKICGASP